MTGFTLAFARGIGEYGSVIFIAGNMPGYYRDRSAADHHQARAVRLCGRNRDRSLMLVASFILLLAINLLQAGRGGGKVADQPDLEPAQSRRRASRCR